MNEEPLAGLHLGKESNQTGLQWRIGAKIGSSKYSSIHNVMESSSLSNSWVVKLAVIKTEVVEAERNRKALQNETLICECKLKHYQGEVIAKLPREVKSSGYVHGNSTNSSYKYLICEKMSGSLWDIVPALLENKKGSQASISISPIAQKLFSCVELLHRKKILLVDCTPASFMLAYEDNITSQAAHNKQGHIHVSETLASRIRVVDVGRCDSSTLENNPIYAAASSYIKQRPPTYRDDLEALGYIIGELVIRITIAAKGKTRDYESNGCTSYLPWHSERTLKVMDDEKEKATRSLHSEFYGKMIDRNVANSIYRYLNCLANQSDSLDYSALKDMLGDLSLQVQLKSHDKENKLTPRKIAKGPSSKPQTPLPTKKKSSTVASNVVVEVIHGPHKGEKCILGKDSADETILTIGSERSKGGKNSNKHLSLNLDSDVEKGHVSLKLACSQKIVKLNVTDHSKSGSACVNGQRIANRDKKQQCMMAFVGDRIQVGNTVLELKLG